MGSENRVKKFFIRRTVARKVVADTVMMLSVISIISLLGFIPVLTENRVALNKADIDDELEKVDGLLEEVEKYQKSGDIEKAFGFSREALETIFKIDGFKNDKKTIQALKKIGYTSYHLHDFDAAKIAWEHVEKYYTDNLEPDDINLQKIRLNLSLVLSILGENEKAKILGRGVLDVYERILNPEDQAFQDARTNYAITLKEMGLYRDALDIEKKVLEIDEIKLKPDDLKLQASRMNLANTYFVLRRYDICRPLYEKTLKVYEKKLPPNHQHLQLARMNLGVCLKRQGALHEAIILYEKVLEVYRRTLREEDRELQKIRMNMAVALSELGEIHKARPLAEKALEVCETVCQPHEMLLQKARTNLATIIKEFGDFEGALALEEKVLSVYEETLAEDDPDYLTSLTNLAQTLKEFGYLERALSLEQKVLKIEESLLGTDNMDLQIVRLNIAETLSLLGRYEEADVILKRAESSYDKSLGLTHPGKQKPLLNLAGNQAMKGNLVDASKMFKRVLDVWKKTLPADHPDLLIARMDYAGVLFMLRQNSEGLNQVELALDGVKRFITRNVLTCSIREVDESVRRSRWILDRYLSLAHQGMVTEEECFQAQEYFRAAGLRAERLRKIIAREGGQEIFKLQQQLREANLRIALKDMEALDARVRERDRIDRVLLQNLMKLSIAKMMLEEYSTDQLFNAIPPGWCVVSFLRYTKTVFPQGLPLRGHITPSYLAFIMDDDGCVHRVDLGPADAVDEMVVLWRNGLSGNSNILKTDTAVCKVGQSLKSMIWDPIREKLELRKNVLIEPDGALATIPFGALPDGEGVLSDVTAFAYVNSLSSLVIDWKAGENRDGRFVTFGGVDYDALPAVYDVERPEKYIDHPASAELEATRDIREDFIEMLIGTDLESKAIARIYERHSNQEALILNGALASKASLIEVAPLTTYLHIATHGYFASERAEYYGGKESRNVDSLMFSGLRRVKGLAPSLLCGLYLAGCNRYEEDIGNPGIITAEEIQGLDLSRCELAVLSACETNLGVIRAGQGIMSIQRALKMAGVKGSVTTLWNVDDQATKIFFEKFYSLLWEKNLHPAEALRQTQVWLRSDLNKDALSRNAEESNVRGNVRVRKPITRSDGLPLFDSPRFWAAFVYWGELQ